MKLTFRIVVGKNFGSQAVTWRCWDRESVFLTQSTMECPLEELKDLQCLKGFDIPIILVFVFCSKNPKIFEVTSLLRSLSIFSTRTFHAIGFVDSEAREYLEKHLPRLLNVGTYELRDVKFPQDQVNKSIHHKPCAALRLFLPDLLPEYDSVIYVDTDIIFLAPLEELWVQFETMSPWSFIGATKELEDFEGYSHYRKPNTPFPFYGPTGINTGVLLMNLTRMRSLGPAWSSEISSIYETFKGQFTLGDQDILNIYFHRHPHNITIIPCRFNYRVDHCLLRKACIPSKNECWHLNLCESAEREGVAVIHGARGAFHDVDETPFTAAVDWMWNLEERESDKRAFVQDWARKLHAVKGSACGHVFHIFLKAFPPSWSLLNY
ncbi:unnamed protein product [Darwinula stevensoni]|uniref:UDP-D-xylose:beta-D-glucoside alpha-1,3-D-xylosyltransferase n=1 Tax=Darwinula stevensoni TaxID=69355 RepID=A0A7R9FR09_9CRUS|nr:unnamed protein product [Darwinula stevensoni]CAG0900400.1 unnamed protein product [Darwinula stevensoni]